MNNLITLMLPVSARDHIEGRDDAPLTLVEYGTINARTAAKPIR